MTAPTTDELLDAYLYDGANGPYSAGDATVRERAVTMLRDVAHAPGVRAAIEQALAERHGR